MEFISLGNWPVPHPNENRYKDIQIRTYTYLPQIVDLSLWCSPIYDQGSLQSCSAQAGAALVEYFARRYGGGNKEVSRRFLYKITRNLMGRTGDSGSSLRETIKAMALFGVPPENYWRYDTANFDEEPTPFCYSFAQNYQALNYFRIDQPNIMGDELLTRIKIALAAADIPHFQLAHWGLRTKGWGSQQFSLLELSLTNPK